VPSGQRSLTVAVGNAHGAATDLEPFEAVNASLDAGRSSLTSTSRSASVHVLAALGERLEAREDPVERVALDGRADLREARRERRAARVACLGRGASAWRPTVSGA